MPRDTLTSVRIVDAALELLDEEGLEGLNMRALGERLGSAATAVYWHVGSKENLVALAGDRAWHEIQLPDPNAMGWRKAAESMATELFAMLGRHPWLVQAFGAFVVFGPGKARFDDHGLAVYEAAGFTPARASQAATSVFTFVVGNALGPAASSSFQRKLERDPEAKERFRESMAKAEEVAKEFPRLRARLGSAEAGYAAAPRRSFEFGLAIMLDGLEGHVVAGRKRTKPRR